MISKNLTWSLVSAASAFVMLSIASGCSSDETELGPAGDSGAGGKTGTGGRRATGGSTSTGAASGAGGGGGAAGAASCSIAFGTICDGLEDCPAGQRCCGRLDPNAMTMTSIRYIEIGCQASCTASEGGTPDVFEICHPSDTCEDSTATCLTSRFLPAGLNRCLPSGVMSTGDPPDPTLDNVKNEINCGTKVCGASEQCCVRMPLDPYCAPRNATCACAEPDAGGGDGGNQTDGSADGSMPTTDGAPTQDASDAATNG